MKILAIDKYEEPAVKEIENNLKDMQRYVMGHIETITLSETAMLVCNDVGKLADLTPNRILKIGNSHDVIRGDFFICGWSGDEFCDISDDDVEKYTKMFSNLMFCSCLCWRESAGFGRLLSRKMRKNISAFMIYCRLRLIMCFARLNQR